MARFFFSKAAPIAAAWLMWLASFGSAAITTTYITTLSSATDAGSYNFGNITVPSGGGLVVCVVNSAAAAGRTVSGVSMGGSAGTSVIATPSSTRAAAIFQRVLPAGAANVTVSIGGGSAARCVCACYMLTGYRSETATDSAYLDVTSTTSAALTLNYAAEGGTGLYGVLKVTDENISWTGPTEDRDAFDENSRVAYATRVDSGASVSSTASWTTSNNATIIGATWEAASAYPQVIISKLLVPRAAWDRFVSQTPVSLAR